MFSSDFTLRALLKFAQSTAVSQIYGITEQGYILIVCDRDVLHLILI